MITLLLAATLLPEAAACSPAPAEPVASYPVVSGEDTALNQTLLILYSGGYLDNPEIEVINSTNQEPIEGNLAFHCAQGFGRPCVGLFKPDGGAWPSNSVVLWEIAPSWVDKDSDYLDEVGMSGSFSTSDWLYAGEPPTDLALTGELTMFIPADQCDDDERILGEFTLSGVAIEPGGLVELIWWEENDADDLDDAEVLTEEAVTAVAILDESGNFAMDLDASILATDNTVCFLARVYSADGTNSSQVDGPCLQWGEEGPNSQAECGGAGCSSSNGPGSPAGIWLGLLGLVAFSRRRSQ
jgi:MYXO-CTERM domain-containing protein